MKFTAKKINLMLETSTVSGENVNLTPTKNIDSRECINIAEQFRALESNNKKLSAVELHARELAIVYDQSTDWFIDNYDPETLREMVIYVAQIMGGMRKNV